MRDFDVRAFGAKGDFSTDDYASFQAAIDAASREKPGGGRVIVPPGNYLIGTKLTITERSCVDLIGPGNFPGDPRSPGSWVGPWASLIWSGSAGGTLLEYNKSQSSRIAFLNFLGRPTTGGNRAGKLIHMKSASGWGTGLVEFHGLRLSDADVGVDIGTNESDPNCADTIWQRVGITSCDIGIRTNNTQSVNHRFNLLSAENCKNVLYVLRGGLVNLDTCNFSGCGLSPGVGTPSYILQFGDSGSADTQGGENLAIMRIANMRCELYGSTPCINLLKIVGNYRAYVNGLIEAQNAQSPSDPMISLQDCGAVFENCYLKTNPLVGWSATGSNRTVVKFRDTKFKTNAFTIGGWITNPTTTNCYYSVEKCETQSNGPFTDVKSGSSW